MGKLWEDIKKFVKDSATDAKERLEEETTLWKIHREIVSFKKEADKKKLELGGHVYEILKTNAKAQLKGDEKITQLIQEIETALAEAETKQQEYDAVKAEAAEKREKEAEKAPESAEATEEPIDVEVVEVKETKAE